MHSRFTFQRKVLECVKFVPPILVLHKLKIYFCLKFKRHFLDLVQFLKLKFKNIKDVIICAIHN